MTGIQNRKQNGAIPIWVSPHFFEHNYGGVIPKIPGLWIYKFIIRGDKSIPSTDDRAVLRISLMSWHPPGSLDSIFIGRIGSCRDFLISSQPLYFPV